MNHALKESTWDTDAIDIAWNKLHGSYSDEWWAHMQDDLYNMSQSEFYKWVPGANDGNGNTYKGVVKDKYKKTDFVPFTIG